MKYKYKECERCAKLVGPVNIWGNIGLAIFKITFGLICGSAALLADAIHSIGDIGVASIMILGVRISGKPPDENHHYGHGKVEFITSGIIGIMILMAGSLIIIYSLRAVLTGPLEPPDRLAALVCILSIFANELMCRQSLCVGEVLNSPVIIANALENRADVWTSVAALIGVVGANLGFPLLDPLAAVLVGVIILRQSYRTLRIAAAGLTDRGADEEDIGRIRLIVSGIKGIVRVGAVRTRPIGSRTFVSIIAGVDGKMTAKQGNEITANIRKSIFSEMENVGEVVTALEPVTI